MMAEWFQGDARVVRQVLRGDQAAFGELVERYLPMVYAQAYGQTRCREDALDVTQDAFLKAFQTLNTLKDASTFAAWLRSITRNRALDYLRRRGREQKRLGESGGGAVASTPDPGREELLGMLRQQIGQLDDSYREVILLYYFSGQRLPDVARGLGISTNAAKKRLQRARQALGAQLASDMTALLEQERPPHGQRGRIMTAIAAAGATGFVGDAVAAGTGVTVAWKIGGSMAACLLLGGVVALLLRSDDPGEAGVRAYEPTTIAAGGMVDVESPPEPAADLAKAVENASGDAEDITSAGNVHGIVLDEAGEPVRGALVWATGADSVMEVTTRQTAEDGRFAFQLEPDYWLVRARVNNRSGAFNGGEGIFEVQAGGSYDGTIRLSREGILRGRIRDAESGEPVPGAVLWLDEGIRATTDGRGRYEIVGLSMANHDVHVQAPGYELTRILFDTSLRDQAALDCFLRPGGRMEGRVLDQSGRPVPGAKLTCPTGGQVIAIAGRQSPVAMDGTYTRYGLTFDQPNTILASAPGYRTAQQNVLVARSEPVATVDFVLESEPEPAVETQMKTADLVSNGGLTIRGAVRNERGNPVGGAEIHSVWLGSKAITRTDDFGRFAVPAEKIDWGFVGVIADGFAPQFVEVDGPVLDVTVERGAYAAGIVLDETGAPLEGVWVVASADFPSPQLTRPVSLPGRDANTDASGRYRIESLPDTGTHFSFLKAGLSDARGVTLDLNSDDNVTTLVARSAIRGKVVDSKGKPIRQFKVRLTHVKGGFWAAYGSLGVDFTVDDGVFVVSDLDEGSVVGVSVIADGYRGASHPEVHGRPINRLPAAGELLFVLDPLPPTTLRVQDVTGKPIPGARVVLAAMEAGQSIDWSAGAFRWQRTAQYSTDDEGRTVIGAGGFDGGVLLISAEGYARQSFPWGQEESETTISLAPESVLEGLIVDVAQYTEPSLMITLNNRATERDTLSLSRDGDGRFRFDGLAAGNYTLQFPRVGATSATVSGPGSPPDLRKAIIDKYQLRNVEISEGEVLVLEDLRLAPRD